MDALEHDDIARSRSTSPEVKLAQALEAMVVGMGLRRTKLQREHPSASPEELDRKFTEWLRRND